MIREQSLIILPEITLVCEKVLALVDEVFTINKEIESSSGRQDKLIRANCSSKQL